MNDRPLLMIPGPIEIAEDVFEATCVRPPSHLAPGFKASFGHVLGAMRQVWCADRAHQPFVVAGTGTLAMESAACNLVDPGQPVLVVNTGYFGDRMAEMLRRRGAEVFQVGAAPGALPPLTEVKAALEMHRPTSLFATHVDTSTGSRVDVAALAALATEYEALSVFDGVCATAAETTLQAAWGADVVLTASQKAIGLPAGLALWMASPRAMAARRALKTPPPMCLDWFQWLPVMEAYEEGRNAYFGTPPTTLIPALEVSLRGLVAEGMEKVFARHERAASRMRAAWAAMELTSITSAPANTLSAIRWPEGADASALPAIAAAGAIVAGGLHPAIRTEYFRVGHMGVVTEDAEPLKRTIRAVGEGLRASGAKIDVEAGLEAFDSAV